jgi:hypothetical protein
VKGFLPQAEYFFTSVELFPIRKIGILSVAVCAPICKTGCMTQPIPENVQAFIVQSIDSIAQLEALLLLRSDSAQSWSAASIAHRLYISEAETRALLDVLTARGLLRIIAGKPGLYQYETDLPENDAMIGQVAELYARYLVPVTRLIHSKPQTRIQQFADAFRVRKDKKDGS